MSVVEGAIHVVDAFACLWNPFVAVFYAALTVLVDLGCTFAKLAWSPTWVVLAGFAIVGGGHALISTGSRICAAVWALETGRRRIRDAHKADQRRIRDAHALAVAAADPRCFLHKSHGLVVDDVRRTIHAYLT